MERRNSLSLTTVIIVLALLALFVGYLLGNWIIQLVVGTSPDDSSQLAENKVVEEEIIVEDDNDSDLESSTSYISKDKNDQETISINQQLSGDVFVVQVGAFSSYSNAVILKEELASKGFQTVITEGEPFKVQLGATTDREKAEKTKEDIKKLGYDAFITH